MISAIVVVTIGIIIFGVLYKLECLSKGTSTLSKVNTCNVEQVNIVSDCKLGEPKRLSPDTVSDLVEQPVPFRKDSL